MRMSSLVGRRHKERPGEALLESHALLLRGGYARQVANGIWSLLPAGMRVVRRIERIIHEEMDRIGGQEVQMPLVLPRELWDESGRYESVGQELLRLRDRTGHDLLLAMTHEEAVVALARHELSSHRQLPFMLYQIQTKFRDEPRSRSGLIRVREFTMKDAYSFHRTQADLDDHYRRCAVAYRRIFARVGLPQVIAVQSDTGMRGGSVAHEFILECDAGEDTLVLCSSCGHRANREVATAAVTAFGQDPLPLRKVHTPAMRTIDEVAGFLGLPPRQTAKVVFYQRDDSGVPVMALIRGDIEINESKLARVIRAQPALADDATILATGAVPGFASPLGVKNCRVIADRTVQQSANLVCGANEADFHFLNFNLTRDAPNAEVVDIAQVRDGDACPSCGSALRLGRGIEVGNIFQLGSRYTAAMGMRYLDAEGREQTPVMGCYGIGVGRLMASVMEARRDQYGPIWPASIAPWQVHIIAINTDAPEHGAAVESACRALEAAGIDVLYDDRNESAGVQFADADLLGIPLRLVFSRKNLSRGVVEVRRRGRQEKQEIGLEAVAGTVAAWIREAEAEERAAADAVAEPF